MGNRKEFSFMKRMDYLSWDAYFMGVALLSAQRSKDNHTQVGACIVNAENKVVSVGYNGMPTGCNGWRIFGYKVCLCLPCGIECDFEPQRSQPARLSAVCIAVPVQ